MAHISKRFKEISGKVDHSKVYSLLDALKINLGFPANLGNRFFRHNADSRLRRQNLQLDLEHDRKAVLIAPQPFHLR